MHDARYSWEYYTIIYQLTHSFLFLYDPTVVFLLDLIPLSVLTATTLVCFPAAYVPLAVRAEELQIIVDSRHEERFETRVYIATRQNNQVNLL